MQTANQKTYRKKSKFQTKKMSTNEKIWVKCSEKNKWHYVYHAIVWLEPNNPLSSSIEIAFATNFHLSLFSSASFKQSFMISFATSIQLIRTVFVQMNLSLYWKWGCISIEWSVFITCRIRNLVRNEKI